MQRVLINIISYNREEMLKNLLNQLEGYDVAIWDDCSDFPQMENMYRFDYNHGKKEAWKKWNKIFEINKKLYGSKYDYFFYLPDDVQLCDNFIEKSIKLWEGIKDPKKLTLSWASKERKEKPCFTATDPVPMGDVILTSWLDMMFMCKKEFLDRAIIDPIYPDRWRKYPNLSSGCGSKLSHLFYQKWGLYHATEEMAVHIGNNDSKMNPEIRHNEPL